MLKEQWESFNREVIPSDAGPIQREEMRRAFYAGAQAAFRGILAMLDPGSEPTKKDIANMDALDKELRDFVKSV